MWDSREKVDETVMTGAARLGNVLPSHAVHSPRYITTIERGLDVKGFTVHGFPEFLQVTGHKAMVRAQTLDQVETAPLMLFFGGSPAVILLSV
jgi:hypothetical protein